MNAVVVELRGCTRDYGAVRAVDRLDLAVVEGEFLALLGPSGCGKTTTLNLIAGFVEPTAGRILIDDEDVTGRPPHLRGLGVVFQSYALFPHLSVYENVAFGLRERRMPAVEIDRRVGEALELVRLDRAGRQRPGELSGGMQQRVALARALVYRPRVLLLDEPLAALDRKLREGMRDELRAIQRSVGITTIFVTHDQAEALGLSDRIAVMSGGRIEQLGTPRAIYEHP
ncbi:MAG TPA: ATP-binding cassette domain-containing protein, partial [Methylomirabilota bacterium]|nr:ATP-binding cassette domain-containing protein [Methylomirabilota bacterium]